MVNKEMVYEDGTSLLDYWNVVWRRRTLIGLIVLSGVIVTAVYSLFITEIYQAEVTIMPISGKNKDHGGLSTFMQQYGGLAGISLPSSASATEIFHLLKSNILRRKVIERYKLLPVLFHEKWDVKKKSWKKNTKAPSIWDGLRALDHIVSVKNNSKDNIMTISVNYYDAEMAAKIANFFVTTLNEHMSSESRRVADTNRKYLEEQLQRTSDPLIKQKIYNLIAQQIETAMMAGVKENFAFKTIDPPMVPDRRIRPKRRRMVMLSFIVMLFTGVMIAFILDYIEKLKSGET